MSLKMRNKGSNDFRKANDSSHIWEIRFHFLYKLKFPRLKFSVIADANMSLKGN